MSGFPISRWSGDEFTDSETFPARYNRTPVYGSNSWTGEIIDDPLNLSQHGSFRKESLNLSQHSLNSSQHDALRYQDPLSGSQHRDSLSLSQHRSSDPLNISYRKDSLSSSQHSLNSSQHDALRYQDPLSMSQHRDSLSLSQHRSSDPLSISQHRDQLTLSQHSQHSLGQGHHNFASSQGTGFDKPKAFSEMYPNQHTQHNVQVRSSQELSHNFRSLSDPNSLSQQQQQSPVYRSQGSQGQAEPLSQLNGSVSISGNQVINGFRHDIQDSLGIPQLRYYYDTCHFAISYFTLVCQLCLALFGNSTFDSAHL